MTYFLAKYSLYDISRENITELNINMQQTHPLKWKQNGLFFFFLMSILSWALYLNLRRFSAVYEGASTESPVKKTSCRFDWDDKYCSDAL